MKSYAVLPFLTAVALAQSQSDGPNCGIITNPPLDNDYPAGTRAIAVALVNINATTVALNQSIDAFDGSTATIVNLQNAASNVLATIQSGNTNVSAIPPNGDDDQGQLATFALITYVGGLACTVNATADNLINSKQALVNACVGPIVLQNAQQQQSESLTFEATVRSKLSPSLQDTSDNFVAPINVALASAVSAFADQTALPASCSSTSSTTTTGSATTTTSSSGNGVDATLTGTQSTTATSGTASGTGIVGPGAGNGGVGNGGNGWLPISQPIATGGAGSGGNGWVPISQPVATGGAGSGGNGWVPISQPVATGGAQPTGGAGWSAVTQGTSSNGAVSGGSSYGYGTSQHAANGNEDEDCEEDYPADNSSWENVEEDCDDDDSATGGSATGGSSSGSAVWEAAPIPSGNGNGNGNHAGPAPTGGSAAGPTYPAGQPTYAASSNWQAIYSGKPSATSNSTWATYTGGAISNIANGMGAAGIAAIAAAAML